MALIKPDLSEVTGAVPPGTYPARITGEEVGVSKKGGNLVKWTFTLFGDPMWNNRVVITRTMSDGKGAFKLQELYKAATGEDLAKDAAFDTEQLLSKEVRLVLIEGKDQDGNVSSFPEVKAFLPYANNQ